MAINNDLAYIAFKTESVAGTAEAIADLSFSVAVPRDSISFDTGIQYNDEVGNVAAGYHGKKESTVGQYNSTFGFSIPYKIPSSIDAAPACDALLQACNLKGASKSTTGYQYVPSRDNDEKTVTIAICYPTSSGNMEYYLFKGCHGTPILGCDGTGSPLQWQLEYSGVYSSSGQASEKSLSGEDTNLSLTWANGSFYKDTFANIDSGSSSNLRVHTWSLEFGVTSTPVLDNSEASGISHYFGTAHNPQLTVTREALKTGTEDMVNNTIAETVSTIELSTGNFRLRIPDAQPLNPSIGSADGLVTWEETYKCLLNGDDSSNLTDTGLGFENYAEVLNGSRS